MAKIKVKYFEELDWASLRLRLELATWESVDTSRVIFSEGRAYRWYFL